MAANGLAHRLYTGDISYDFVGKRKRWYTISAVAVAICLIAVLARGLNVSIDFKGGSAIEIQAKSGKADPSDLRRRTAGLPCPLPRN